AQVITAADDSRAAAAALAAIDVAAALATLGVERGFVRPEVDASRDFVITGGRHPVVEQALARDGGPFVANDCDLSPPPPFYPPPAPVLPLSARGGGLVSGAEGAGRIYLVTGPNMAGKVTPRRPNAPIPTLPHLGSYLPARHGP